MKPPPAANKKNPRNAIGRYPDGVLDLHPEPAFKSSLYHLQHLVLRGQMNEAAGKHPALSGASVIRAYRLLVERVPDEDYAAAEGYYAAVVMLAGSCGYGLLQELRRVRVARANPAYGPGSYTTEELALNKPHQRQRTDRRAVQVARRFQGRDPYKELLG